MPLVEGPRFGWRWLGLLLVVVGLVTLGLYPFRFDPPGWRQNELVRSPDGPWVFGAHNVARSAGPPEFLARVRQDGAMRIVLELRTGARDQRGPARIFTIARDDWNSLLTIGQMGEDLVVRLRRPGSSDWGTPPFAIRGFFADPRWRRVALELSPAAIRIDPDGEVALREALPEGYWTDWVEDCRLALGDGVRGGRAWRGEAREVVVEGAGWRIDLLRDDVLESPELSYFVPDRLRDAGRFFRDDPIVIALHLASFVPLGFLFVAIWGLVSGPGKGLVFGGFLALSIQLAKIFFESRHPCLIDVPAQVAGVWLGIKLAASLPSARMAAERSAPPATPDR